MMFLHPRRRDLLPPRLAVIGWVAVAMLTADSVGQAATWTDLRGTHTIEADLMGIWGDQVILRKADGTRLAVRLTALRADSRIQAERLNEALLEHRSVRISELAGSAAEAEAPAPTPLPTPPPAPEYQPPVADMDPGAFVEHLNAQAEAGHLLVLYDRFPPSQRTKIDEYVALATSKIDPTQWSTVVTALHELGDLIVTRQNWIFSHPRFSQLPEDAQLRLKELVLGLAGVLRVGLEPDAVSLEKMQSMPLRDWLVERDQALAPYLAQLNGLAPQSAEVNVEAVQDDTATVNVNYGPLSQKLVLKKVEGFWIPENWDASILAAKESLAAKANGEVLSGGGAALFVSSLQPLLAPLRQATNATEFHVAMESTFRTAQPLAEMVASIDMSRFVPGGPAAGNRGGYADEYGGGDPYDSPEGYSGGDPYEEGMEGYSGSDPYEEGMEGYSGSSDEGAYEAGPGASSSGPPTNAMEAARAAAANASQAGVQGGGSQDAAQRAAAEAAQRAATGGRP